LTRYVSPSEDQSNYGVLAAFAVRQLSACMHNFIARVDAVGSLRLDPPVEVHVPSMKIYTYIPVTQSIVCRPVVEEVVRPEPRRIAAIGRPKASRRATATKDEVSKSRRAKRGREHDDDDLLQSPVEDDAQGDTAELLATPRKDGRQGDGQAMESTVKRPRSK
jgi:hypothetical protein